MSNMKQQLTGLEVIALLSAAIYGISLLVGGTLPADSAQTTSDSSIDTSNSVLQLLKQPLPDFTVSSQNGETIESTTFHDKPILIMEQASWCIYCQHQMPIIQAVFDKYGDQVDFVLINATGFNGEPKETAQQYMQENGYSLPWYVDPGMATANTLHWESTPTLYIVDKDQTIFTSVQTEEAITTALEAVLH